MTQKETALQHIEEIMGVIRHNVKTIIPGSLMIAIGVALLAIPGIEWIWSKVIDPFFLHAGSFATPLNFLAHTAFYWIAFTYLGNYFNPNEQRENAIIKQVFAIGKFFPIIPVTLAACLAATGNSILIAPLILILVGCLFALYGQFTSRIITIGAMILLIGGFASILITPYTSAHLWQYLLIFQGLVFIIMGILLYREQATTH